MKGFKEFLAILLVQCQSIMMASIDQSNTISNPNGDELCFPFLKMRKAIQDVVIDFKAARKVKDVFVQWSTCGKSRSSTIKQLDALVLKTRDMQKNERIATASGTKKGTKSYENKFLEIEFFLRSLSSKLRRIEAINKKSKRLPFKLNNKEDSESYEELRKIEECLKDSERLFSS
eukprot:Seg1597.3 transcript_id=Seg1597.3/GoldUCD/mRNA.D3Y31 product="hypothetical protein" protein_id=Seg1597.3/GoldUCD/D3Y31